MTGRLGRTLAGRALAALTLAALLAGCWDVEDINRRTYLLGLGLDAGSTPETIRVTIQFISPTSPAAGGELAISPSGQEVSAEAATVGEALDRIRFKTERRIDVGNAALVVLGRRLAEQGLDRVMGYLVRTPDLRWTALVMVADGTAEEFFRARPSEPSAPAWQAILFFRNERLGGEQILNAPLWRFASHYFDPYRSALIPLVRMDDRFTLLGGAVITDGRPAVTLGLNEARMLYRRSARPVMGIIELPQFQPTPGVRVEKVEMYMQLVSGCLTVRGNLRVSPVEAPPVRLEPRAVWEMEKAVETQLEQRFAALVRKMQAAGADPFGFGEMARRQGYPLERWRQIYPDLPVCVQVRTRIHRTDWGR